MGCISTERKEKLSKFFTEFWAMVKAYGTPDDSDEYWDSVTKAVGKLNNDNKMPDGSNDPIVFHVVRGYVGGLEEEWRRTREVSKI